MTPPASPTEGLSSIPAHCRLPTAHRPLPPVGPSSSDHPPRGRHDGSPARKEDRSGDLSHGSLVIGRATGRHPRNPRSQSPEREGLLTLLGWGHTAARLTPAPPPSSAPRGGCGYPSAGRRRC